MDFRRQMNDLCACIFRQDELYDIWAKHSGMKPSTVTVLYMLDQFSEMTQGGIAQMCLLPKQTIHTVVQELEQAGYLEKVSVSGRKEKPLRLTGIRQALHSEQAGRSVPRRGTRRRCHGHGAVRHDGGNDPKIYRFV